MDFYKSLLHMDMEMLIDQFDMQFHLNNIHMLMVDIHLYLVYMNIHKFHVNVE